MERLLRCNGCFITLLSWAVSKISAPKDVRATAAKQYDAPGCMARLVRWIYAAPRSLLTGTQDAERLCDALFTIDLTFYIFRLMVNTCICIQRHCFEEFKSIEQKRRIMCSWGGAEVLDVSPSQQLLDFLNEVDWLDAWDASSDVIRADTSFLNGFEHKPGCALCGGVIEVQTSATQVTALRRVEYDGSVYLGTVPEEVCLNLLLGLHMYVTVCSHLAGAHFLTAFRFGRHAALQLPPKHRIRRLHLPTELNTGNVLGRAIGSLLVPGTVLHCLYPLTWDGLRGLVRSYLLKNERMSFDRALTARLLTARLLAQPPRLHLVQSSALWLELLHDKFIEPATRAIYPTDVELASDAKLCAWLTALVGSTRRSDLNWVLTHAYFIQVRHNLWSNKRFTELTNRLVLKLPTTIWTTLRVMQTAVVTQLDWIRLMNFLPSAVQRAAKDMDQRHVHQLYTSSGIEASIGM